jgi:glycosyltransferase involved in cell wall biosynthesis
MIRSAAQSDYRRVLAVMRWPVGGIRTYIIDNYRPLGDAGYCFTFVGPADDAFRRFRDDLSAWPGVEFVEAPMAGRSCRLRSTVRSQLRTGRFSIVHSQGLIAGAAVALANRALGVPHVITSHGVIQPDDFPGPLGGLKRWALARLVRRSTAMIAVSHDAMRNHIHCLPGLDRGKCRLRTIVNGIDMNRLSLNGSYRREALRERLGLSDEVLLIGFLGRFMKEKGFPVLVEALDRLARQPLPRTFHLVAVGSDDYASEYRAEAERRPELVGRMTFVDVMPSAVPVLGGLDLLVMPSLWEACGLLAMEAMCLGIPVLGSDCIGLREVLHGSPSMQVPAGDPDALSQGISRAMTNPWTENARQYVPQARRRFDVAPAARQLSDIFDDAQRTTS